MKTASAHGNAKFPAASGVGAAALHHRDRVGAAGIEAGGTPDFTGELARALVPARSAPETQVQSVELTHRCP